MERSRIVLCADDFAISRGTSEVIAKLVRGRCINAVSCMSAAQGWAEDAPLLLAAVATNPQVEIGLHLTLSDRFPIGPMTCLDAECRLPGPDRLLLMCLARSISRAEFAAEIERQFAAFQAAVGRPPDFVDAHQHVHLYPILRELVVDAVARYARSAWVRVPTDSLSAILQRPYAAKALGSALHSVGFRRLLKRKALRHNESFAGHYDFGSGYEDYLPQFFKHPSPFHVVMCHPGAGDLPGDEISRARAREAEVLGRLPLGWRLATVSIGS